MVEHPHVSGGLGGSIPFRPDQAPVAQLVELRFCKPPVGGSIPSWGSKIKKGE